MNDSSLLTLVDKITKKAPEYIDLLTAESDEKFETAFDAILGRVIHDLEKNKKNYDELDEEGLTAVIATGLSMPGLKVTQETNSNGHVDIMISVEYCSPVRTKLGEAKIYDGYKYHMGGLEQLLGRYTTGREGRGLLIVYVRKKDIKTKMQDIESRMNKELPHNQSGSTNGHSMKWAFISSHTHSSGEVLDVCHIGCNLHIS